MRCSTIVLRNAAEQCPNRPTPAVYPGIDRSSTVCHLVTRGQETLSLHLFLLNCDRELLAGF